MSLDSPGDLLGLIRSGAAASRSDVAKLAGVSASTAAARVEDLLAAGYLREAGAGSSRGGRRPRRLAVDQEFGVVGAADLGTHHATLAVMDLDGRPLVERKLEMRIDAGPETVLRWVWQQIGEMSSSVIGAGAGVVSDAGIVAEAGTAGPAGAAGSGAGVPPLRALSIGLPGPVDWRVGRVVSPSRMPGWHGVDVRALLADVTDVPVLVDNDANLMALGELAGARPGAEHLIFLKAGSGIGCGVIASGRLHRGSHGAAGDIGHVEVANAPAAPCSCGRSGCLDAVASGAALVRGLQREGFDVADTAGVLELARRGEPVTARMLRDAGRATGEVLATVVNFFNPDAVVLGGQLSQAEAFVASLRSTLYERCLPMATEALDITVSKTGAAAGVLGGGRLALDHVFDPARVNAALSESTGAAAGSPV